MATHTNKQTGSNPRAKRVVIISARESGPTGTYVRADAPDSFATFQTFAQKLMRVSKDEIRDRDTTQRAQGRAMTREIELDPTETEALRRARTQVKEGNVIDEAELDKRIAADEE